MKGKKIDMLKAEPPLTPAVLLGYDDSIRLKSTIILFKLSRVQWSDWRINLETWRTQRKS